MTSATNGISGWTVSLKLAAPIWDNNKNLAVNLTHKNFLE